MSDAAQGAARDCPALAGWPRRSAMVGRRRCFPARIVRTARGGRGRRRDLPWRHSLDQPDRIGIDAAFAVEEVLDHLVGGRSLSLVGCAPRPTHDLVHDGFDVDLVVPEASHMRAGCEELVQMSGSDDVSVVEDNDVVGLLEGGASV